MKYAIRYDKDFRHLNEIDEIIFKYAKEYDIEDVFIRIKENNSQRIIFNIIKEEITWEDISFFVGVRDRHPATAILLRIDHPMRESIIEELKKEKIPFFFYDFADTWDKLTSMVKVGVSDIYIVSDLGFDIIKASDYCHKNNVQVRVFPNVAQISSKIENLPSITSFFIRPEDIDMYEPYVDICELFGDLNRQSVLYEIYQKKKWLGNLKDLMLNFNSSIGNSTLPPNFYICRLDCRKKCNADRCKMCYNMESVSQLFEKNNLVFERKKD